MSKNFVLVDFENVQPASIALLAHEQYRLLVFVGASQNKLPTEVVIGMQAMGARAEYVRASGSGRNALDFHIAYYLGQLAAQHPDAAFHVISRDTGFDPLVAFMRSRGIPVDRLASLEAIAPQRSGTAVAKSNPAPKAASGSKVAKPAVPVAKKPPPAKKQAPAKTAAKVPSSAASNKAPASTSIDARVAEYIAVFGRPQATHPKSEATLASSIRTHFGKNIAAKEIAEIIKGLVARGFLTIVGGKVSYT